MQGHICNTHASIHTHTHATTHPCILACLRILECYYPQDEKESQVKKSELERLYKLPDHPSIVVHPSVTAKSGKFDCAVMSLSVLLDYRPEDNKEHTFEVSSFLSYL